MEGKYGEATSEAKKMLGPDPQVYFLTAIMLGGVMLELFLNDCNFSKFG